MRRLATILLFTTACGASTQEVQQKLDAQLQGWNAQLDRAQAEITRQNQVIAGLESKVQEMGGDLAQVREELGQRATQLASTKTKLAATTVEVEQLRKLRARAEAEKAQFKALTEKFQAMIDAGQLSVVRRDGRMMLKLPDEILFPSGSPNLKKGGTEALREVARVLLEVGGNREYLVAGHTDNVPLRRGARFKNNWYLSTARANAVVQLMIDEGVPSEQLAAAGYGEHDPIASNETPEGRQQNRRLEIILMPDLTALQL
ncbi:MAG: OmpA family protein [Myxococcota bacterium]